MLLVILFVSIVICAGVGAYVAEAKNRPTGEGVALGSLLGPLGVLIVALLPTLEAPPEPDPEELEASRRAREKQLEEIRQHVWTQQKLEEARAAQRRAKLTAFFRRTSVTIRDVVLQVRSNLIWLVTFRWMPALPEWVGPIVIGLLIGSILVAGLVALLG